METIKIKDKEYVTVNERLKEFRNTYAGYSIQTDIVELGQDYCTIKASIIDENGVIRSTGYAREVVAKSPINKFAFVENCETSAIGRALGNFGIGIDTAVCSADELLMKLSQDEPKQRDDFEKDATAEKRAFNKAVKEGADKAPEPKNSLTDRANKCIAWLEKNDAQTYKSAANSAKDSAHDVRDACLASNLPALTELGVKIANKLREFEPELDDVIPY